jgi:phosphate-selective porin OprO/OprP
MPFSGRVHFAAIMFVAAAQGQSRVVVVSEPDGVETESRGEAVEQLPMLPKALLKAPSPASSQAPAPESRSVMPVVEPAPAPTSSRQTNAAGQASSSERSLSFDAQSRGESSHQPNENKKHDSANAGDSKTMHASEDGANAEDSKKSEDLGLTANWRHGLELTSQKKDFRIHVGGRYHFDAAWYDAPAGLQAGQGGVGALEDGVTFRRARFRMDGTMYGTIDWAAEFDFVNGASGAATPAINTPAVTDLYVEFTRIPVVGALRVGCMKEPYSFEHLTSSRWLHFIERSTNFDPFAERFYNGFTPGVMLHDTYDGERGTWWLGVFHDTNVPFGFGVGDQQWAYDARVTYLPVWDDCNDTFVHVGAAYSRRNLVDDRVRLRTRPSVRSAPGPLTPFLADTGVIASTIQDLAGLELVAVSGSWTWQSEYYASRVQDAATLPAGGAAGVPLGSLFFTGWYAEALYFLTGETREYNRKLANFDRVKPCRDFRWAKDDCECGDDGRRGGAWQIGVRYSHTDLLDGGVGAVLDDWTLGLNWFLNPNLKVQWNYVATHRRAPAAEGWIHGFGIRTAFDF